MRTAISLSALSMALATPAFSQALPQSLPADQPPTEQGSSAPDAPAVQGAAPQTDNAAPSSTGATSGGLQDIVVTAQRRSENLQKVPIAVTAVTEETLISRAVTSTQQLPALVPGLVLANNGSTIEPFLRGVGNNNNSPGNELPVAVYIDNVYVASANSNLLDLADVSSVSVLKGPQGTLFGRNAVGGVIQVTTKTPRPDQPFEGNVGVSIDNYATLRTDVFVAGSVSPDIAASLSGVYSTQGRGWGHNNFTGEESRKLKSNIGLRGKLVFTPGPDTKITLSGDYSRRRDSLSTQFTPYAGTNLVLNRYVPSDNPWDSYSNQVSRFSFNGGGASATIDQDLKFAHLVSISAYRADKLRFSFDLDGGAIDGWRFNSPDETTKTFSQELQLNSANTSGIKWTAGLYYFNGTAGVGRNTVEILPAVPAYFGQSPVDTLITQNARQHTESISGYGQATAEIVRDTNLTVGLRYTAERRRFRGDQAVAINGMVVADPQFPGKLSFEKPTWRFALDHAFTPRILGYASYSRGFKSGGFNTLGPSNPPYLPEGLDAYEIGLKSELFDRHLRVNTALFDYERSNIQVNRYLGTTQAIYNGAKARVRGVDVDFALRATTRLTLSGGFVWLDSKFTSFPNAILYTTDSVTGSPIAVQGSAAGNQVPFSAKFSGNIGLDYGFSSPIGRIDLNVANSYNSGFYTEPDNHLRQRPYNLLSSSIKVAPGAGKFTVLFWARNLLDKAVAGQIFSDPSLGYLADYSNPPRTFGVTVKTAF